jgi:hypothetical protein
MRIGKYDLACRPAPLDLGPRRLIQANGPIIEHAEAPTGGQASLNGPPNARDYRGVVELIRPPTQRQIGHEIKPRFTACDNFKR